MSWKEWKYKKGGVIYKWAEVLRLQTDTCSSQFWKLKPFHHSILCFVYLCAFSPQWFVFLRTFFVYWSLLVIILGCSSGRQFTRPVRSVTGIYKFVRQIFPMPCIWVCFYPELKLITLSLACFLSLFSQWHGSHDAPCLSRHSPRIRAAIDKLPHVRPSRLIPAPQQCEGCGFGGLCWQTWGVGWAFEGRGVSPKTTFLVGHQCLTKLAQIRPIRTLMWS